MIDDLPPFEVHQFHRRDKGDLMGSAIVTVAGHVHLRCKLVRTASGPVTMGPSVPNADRSGWDRLGWFSGRLRFAINEVMVEEYGARPEPGRRDAPCRSCGDLVRYQRGIPTDPATGEPHPRCESAA